MKISQVMMYSYDFSTHQIEAGRILWVQGHLMFQENSLYKVFWKQMSQKNVYALLFIIQAK